MRLFGLLTRGAWPWFSGFRGCRRWLPRSSFSSTCVRTMPCGYRSSTGRCYSKSRGVSNSRCKRSPFGRCVLRRRSTRSTRRSIPTTSRRSGSSTPSASTAAAISVRETLQEFGYFDEWSVLPSVRQVSRGITRWLRTDGLNVDLGTQMTPDDYNWRALGDTGNRPGLARAIEHVMRHSE